MKKAVQRFYIGLIFLFLYAPILLLIAFSFNESKSRSNFTGFTFDWYVELFQDELIMTSLMNTLVIAVISSVIATVIGTAAAIGISNMKKRARNLVMNISYTQIVSPEIVTGVSLMLLFVFMKDSIGLEFGFITILIAHITFNLPYVVLNVMPKLRQMDNSLYEAAQDLGCSPIRAFFKVVIPEIMPGIISGFMMAFTLSLDDFVISYFVSPSNFQTLPLLIYSMTKKTVKPDMYALFVISYFTSGSSFQTLPITIYSMTKKRVSPKINALSAILFVVVLVGLILVNIKDSRDAKKKITK